MRTLVDLAIGVAGVLVLAVGAWLVFLAYAFQLWPLAALGVGVFLGGLLATRYVLRRRSN